MAWFLLTQLFSTVIQLVLVRQRSDQQKGLEILILRYQLATCERKLETRLKPSRGEKLTVAVLVAHLKQRTQQPAAALGLREGERLLVLPFQPNQFLLVKIDVPDEVSAEEVARMMRQAFKQSGYTSRDQVVHLVREIKQEMAQEW